MCTSVCERALLFLVCCALSGCGCFVPVEECVGKKCFHLDGGAKDGGTKDGGVDAGRSDGGVMACAIWDGGGVGKCAALTGYVALGNTCRGECVEYPIVTPGVFPSLAACVSCGCDPAKLSAKPAQAINANAFCDEVGVTTTLPRLLDEAFDAPDAGAGGRDFDGGCTAMGAVDFACLLLGKGSLGDAGMARVCAATLVPYVTDVQCRVFIN